MERVHRGDTKEIYRFGVLAGLMYASARDIGVEISLPDLDFDNGELMTLTFGMLGMGGLRSWDKMKGVSTERIIPTADNRRMNLNE